MRSGRKGRKTAAPLPSSTSGGGGHYGHGYGHKPKKLSLAEFLDESADEYRLRMEKLRLDEQAIAIAQAQQQAQLAQDNDDNDDFDEEEEDDEEDTCIASVLSSPSPLLSSVSLSSAVGNGAGAPLITSSAEANLSITVVPNTLSSPSSSPSSSPPLSSCIMKDGVRLPLRLQRMEHLLRHCQAGALVAFDLDDTIHISKYHPSLLMTTPGVNYFQQLLKSDERYCSLPLAVKNKHIRRLQASLQDKRLVEGNIAWVIRELQEAGCRVFALTARYAEMAISTTRALRSLGIDFAANAPFPPGSIRDPETEAVCDEGVIYTNATDKGTVLNRFLHYVALPYLAAENAASNGIVVGEGEGPPLVLPCEIVFVDDRLANARSVQCGLPIANQFNIPITCYHYVPAPVTVSSRTLPHPQPIAAEEVDEEEIAVSSRTLTMEQEEVIRIQIDHFISGGTILTDEEAKNVKINTTTTTTTTTTTLITPPPSTSSSSSSPPSATPASLSSTSSTSSVVVGGGGAPCTPVVVAAGSSTSSTSSSLMSASPSTRYSVEASSISVSTAISASPSTSNSTSASASASRHPHHHQQHNGSSSSNSNRRMSDSCDITNDTNLNIVICH